MEHWKNGKRLIRILCVLLMLNNRLYINYHLLKVSSRERTGRGREGTELLVDEEKDFIVLPGHTPSYIEGIFFMWEHFSPFA
jgi:hypothetical protein